MVRQLINVTSRATLVARAVSAVTFATGFAVHFGWIDLETADNINTWAAGKTAEQIIVGAALIIGAIAPSIPGWISRDRELPDGVQLDDVEVRTNTSGAGLKQERLIKARTGKAVAFFLAAGMAATVLSACSCPQRGSAPMSMAQQQAAGICVYQP